MLKKMRGIEGCLDLGGCVRHYRLFQRLGQEAAFRTVVMMPVAVVFVMMMSGLVFPKMHDGHRHLVVMVVGHRRMSQQYCIGYQQHHYEKRFPHAKRFSDSKCT